MKYAIYISFGLLAFLTLIGALFFFFRPTVEPEPVVQQQFGTMPNQTVVTVPFEYGTAEAVQEGFNNFLAPGVTVEFGNTAIVNGWALQNWSNEPMGGEGLLRYDDSKKEWVMVEMTGGSFSIAALHAAGVPQRTVLALRAELKNPEE